jgi:hypothetical protein
VSRGGGAAGRQVRIQPHDFLGRSSVYPLPVYSLSRAIWLYMKPMVLDVGM